MSYLYYFLGFFAYVVIAIAFGGFCRAMDQTYNRHVHFPTSEAAYCIIGGFWPIFMPIFLILFFLKLLEKGIIVVSTKIKLPPRGES